MFKSIGQEKIFCGLDIGSQTLKAALIKATDQDQSELLGAYQNPTHGYKNGSVTDLSDFSECIYNTVNQLTDKVGVKVKEIHVAMGGSFVEVRPTSTVIPLVERGNKVITQRDIKTVNDQARLLGVKMEEETIHDLPQSYQVDDVSSVLNPEGLYGRKLGVHSLMVVLHGNRMRNMTKAVNQAGFDVGSFHFNSLVGQEVSLSSEDKIGGCVLIDMGAFSTNVLIFKDGVLKFYERFELGGYSLTQAISEKLNLPFDLAEEIKQSYADASSDDFKSEEEILVKKENAYMPIKREVIYESISVYIEQMIACIQKAIRNSGMASQMNRGVVLAGGAALLPGLIERIDNEVFSPARLASISVKAQKNIQNAAVFYAAIGAAQAGLQQAMGHLHGTEKSHRWFDRLSKRVSDLYQEYF